MSNIVEDVITRLIASRCMVQHKAFVEYNIELLKTIETRNHTVAFLSLTTSNKRIDLVLKIFGTNAYVWEHSFYNEVRGLELFASKGFLAPRIVYSDATRHHIPYQFLVITYLHGCSWNPLEQAQLAESLGKFLGNLSNAFLCGNPESYLMHNGSFVKTKCERARGHLDKIGSIISAKVVNDVLKCVDYYLPEPSAFGFVLHDLKPDHIFLSRDCSNYGLIDFENTFADDPIVMPAELLSALQGDLSFESLNAVRQTLLSGWACTTSSVSLAHSTFYELTKTLADLADWIKIKNVSPVRLQRRIDWIEPLSQSLIYTLTNRGIST